MKAVNTDNHIIFLKQDKIHVYDLKSQDKVPIIKKNGVSDIISTDEHFYFSKGTAIFMLNPKTDTEKRIIKHKSAINNIFYLDNALYFSDALNSINVFILREERASLFKQFRHKSPITSIASDGNIIAVTDMTDKLTVYDSNGEKCYDMVRGKLKYCGHIFATEKNVIYCCTKETLGKFISFEDQVLYFTFSKNGGVLFVQLCGRIEIYEVNTRNKIRDISVFFDSFIYEDESNRIVGYIGKTVEYIDDVLEGSYEEISNLMFQDRIVHEKKVFLEDVDNKEHKMRDLDILFTKKYTTNQGGMIERQLKDFSNGQNMALLGTKKRKKADGVKTSSLSRKNKLESLFDEENSYEKSNDEEGYYEKEADSYDGKHDKEDYSKRRNVVDMESQESEEDNGDVGLFYFDHTGYLLFLKGPISNKIELKYHDRFIPSIEIEDNEGIVTGTFNNEYIVLSNRKQVYLYKKKLIWAKRLYNKGVAIWRSYILVFGEDLKLLNFDGDEVFTIAIFNIEIICCCDKYVAIFSDKLIVTDFFTFTQEYSLSMRIQNSSIYKDRLYVSSNKTLYAFINGLFFKVLDDLEILLCIHQDKALCLESLECLVPTPRIKYREIPKVFLEIGLGSIKYSSNILSDIRHPSYAQDDSISKSLNVIEEERSLGGEPIEELKSKNDREKSKSSVCDLNVDDEISFSDSEMDVENPPSNASIKKFSLFK